MKNITHYSMAGVCLIGSAILFVTLSGCTTPVTNVPANESSVSVNTNSNNNKNEADTNATITTDPIVDEPADQDTNDGVTEDPEPITDPGVTWLAEPALLDDLGLYKDEYPESFYYYKIADLDDGGAVIYVAQSGMGVSVQRFRKDGDGNYYLLSNHSGSYTTNPADYLAEGVQVDATTVYASLEYPDNLTVNDLALNQEWPPFAYQEFFDTALFPDSTTPAHPDTGTVTQFGTTAYGTLYEVVEPIYVEGHEGIVELKKYLLVLSDTSTVIYKDTKNFLADDGTLIATTDGLDGQSFFAGIVADGCGFPSNGDQIVSDLNADRLTSIGTTPSGEPLYTLANDDDELNQLAYDTYGIGREAADLQSYENFVATTPVILWQDATGAYLVFMDKEYAPNVECGKPVIYLYPTQPTAVSVRVGADITVSEPTYHTGWKVIAQPTGALQTAMGETVRSLYWEGKGHGAYPAINRGRVVASANIETELRTDLTALGLNAQETADFLEFWLPKMPATQYVRLTWLGTNEMNVLAPLTITPRPDTMLRVFLDFTGQVTAETNLQPQVLRPVQRRGFTVVEWGGVLVGGHQSN